jgi:hypothetical protein
MFPATARNGKPKLAHDGGVSSQTLKREDATVPPADPLALNPYSPIFPARAPEEKDSDPLALDPYSPTFPARVSERQDAGRLRGADA